MKRLAIIFSLILLLNNVIFASEDVGDYTVDVGVGFLYPIVKDDNVGVNILVSLLLSSFSIGGGYYFNVVENVFSPGVYGDIHVYLLPLLSDSDEEDENEVGFYQLGIRLANQFRFDFLEIQPFYGINCMLGTATGTHMLNVFGISLTHNRFGLEYGYQMPFEKDISSVHRIVFKVNLKKMFE